MHVLIDGSIRQGFEVLFYCLVVEAQVEAENNVHARCHHCGGATLCDRMALKSSLRACVARALDGSEV